MSAVSYKIPQGWEEVFEEAKDELAVIFQVISKYGEFLPRQEELFAAFEKTPLDKVKVVILGQDPYHSIRADGLPEATGMSFSVRPDSNVPPSLVNIFKEIKSSYPEFVPKNKGDLSHWAEQGVLLLNQSLTVSPHKAGSHGSCWMMFINVVLKRIIEVNPKTIFVLWGAKAKVALEIVGSQSISLIAAHPSPLSASRGFFGCGHFRLINEELAKQGRELIQW